MDCVSCVVMGMCMLCRPGMVPKSPGRPFTAVEVENAVRGHIKHLEESAAARKAKEAADSEKISYDRRQSYISDPKYGYMGIGKRFDMDPFRFEFGIGKRATNSDNQLRKLQLISNEIKRLGQYGEGGVGKGGQEEGEARGRRGRIGEARRRTRGGRERGEQGRGNPSTRLFTGVWPDFRRLPYSTLASDSPLTTYSNPIEYARFRGSHNGHGVQKETKWIQLSDDFGIDR